MNTEQKLREALRKASDALTGPNPVRRKEAIDAISEALAEPAQPAVAQEPVAWVNSIMEQAQVFASAWSLVGGIFDNGTALKHAEQMKSELRSMLSTHPAPAVAHPPADVVRELVEALRKAEAALSDIGDAEREPDDDVEWCEGRAAQDLPMIRAALVKWGV